MSIDPVSAGLLAASVGSTGLGLANSKSQQRVEMASIGADAEAARLQTQEQAFQTSQNFRKALSSQLALSSLRGAAGSSMTRQFAAESVANMLADQRGFERKQQFINTATSLRSAQAKSARFGRDISAIGSLLTTGINAVQLNRQATNDKRASITTTTSNTTGE